MIILKHGNDFSYHQGVINWDEVKQSGCDFVILRAGYGKHASQKDTTFDFNHAECMRLGIPCGAYWYAYWGVDPTVECDVFLSVIGDKKLDCGIWYDVEYEPFILAETNKTRTDLTIKALEYLSQSGRFVGLYASTDMINNRMEWERLAPYSVWNAQYGTLNTCKAPYSIWQYTSSGTIGGVNGRVDCNKMYVDLPTIIKNHANANTLMYGNGYVPPIDGVEGEEQPQPKPTATIETQPMTRGDLYTFLNLAKDKGLYVTGTLVIGEMTEGDYKEFETLACDLNIELDVIERG